MTPKSLVPQRAVQVGRGGSYLDHLLSFLSDYVTDTLSSAPQLDALVFSGGIGERARGDDAKVVGAAEGCPGREGWVRIRIWQTGLDTTCRAG
jgi:hypothetical protein